MISTCRATRCKDKGESYYPPCHLLNMLRLSSVIKLVEKVVFEDGNLFDFEFNP